MKPAYTPPRRDWKKEPFAIIARPTHRLSPCQKWHDERDHGLIGFHRSDTCPDCRTEFTGWELHGENGHIQGRLADVEPATIARAVAARSTVNPVTITISDSGYTYLA